ncbi:MAG: hypothetical protein DCC67_00215 [Planctomycetota bacterium]|nr:MAG: hypothetical protein DCC67_00215 [Planctomycetota bacterium]
MKHHATGYCLRAVCLVVVAVWTAALAPLALSKEMPVPAAAVAASRHATASNRATTTVANFPDGWWFVDSQGRRFFSRGVGVLSPGTPVAAFDASKPSYAALRHYDSLNAWADSSLKRLKFWQFTTIGGWADLDALHRSAEHDLWMTPVVPLGAAGGAPWLNMWDPERLAAIDQLARQEIAPWRDDPRVIGYYCDNERGWWNAELWRLTLEQPPDSRQRMALIEMLKRDYHDDWSELTKDFVPSDGVGDWQSLSRGGGLRHRPGSDGIRTMRRFLALAADRYYQVMAETIRRHDPDALFLGDRYQSFYYPEVARACGKYADVASTNLSASWNDGGFLRCYLDSLHRLSGKPLLVSEFYMAAAQNRSGNKNTGHGFPVVSDQRARAAAVTRSLAELTSKPYVVGVEWFQYFDEPPHGRFDGEDYDFGLVDIDDRPYDELTAVFAEFDFDRLGQRRRAVRPDAGAGVPPAPADPFGVLGYMTGLEHWDRERGFVPAASDAPLADLYLCWMREALYVGLYAIDPVERSYYGGGPPAAEDRALWRLKLDDRCTATIRLGSGQPPAADLPGLRVESYSGVDNIPRLIAVVEIPAAQMGRAELRPGDAVALDGELVTHGRAYRYHWHGVYTLAD